MFVQSDTCFPVTYAEKRRSPRRRPAREVVARLIDDDDEELGVGLVWNLSRTGVSLLLNGQLEPGTHLDLELMDRQGRERVRVGMCVIHRGQLQTGDYVLGGQFTRPLEETELEPLVY